MFKSKWYIFCLFIVFLLLGALSGCLDDIFDDKFKEEFKEEMQREVLNAFKKAIEDKSIVIAASAYYGLNNKWPKSLDELKSTADCPIRLGEDRLSINLEQYEKVAFLPLQNGDLEIEYSLKKNPSKTITVIVPLPKSGKKE